MLIFIIIYYKPHRKYSFLLKGSRLLAVQALHEPVIPQFLSPKEPGGPEPPCPTWLPVVIMGCTTSSL